MTARVNTLRNNRTLTQQVAERLREAILEGKLPGGHTLRQEELAEQLGVSRIPVREALRQLEAEGFVVLHPHRGAVVATLSSEEAVEIYDIRAALEMQALRLAVPNLTREALAQAEALLDKMDDVGEGRNMARWAELNWQFHAALYAAANRPRLFEMIKQLHDNVGRYLRGSLSVTAHSKPAQKQHRALLAACKKKDMQAAVDILGQHLATTSQKLAQQLLQHQQTRDHKPGFLKKPGL